MSNKILNPSAANKVVDEIIKSKKYSYVKRAMNPKSPMLNKNETLQTKGADGVLFPTIRRNKRGRLRKYRDQQAMKIAKQKKDAISIVDIAPTYVSTKDVSLALSKRIGEARGVPPKKGPNPQGLKTGGINSGCPYRENGVKSDIKGISSIQIKGKKFIGVK
mgnify:CR=1 FL=1